MRLRISEIISGEQSCVIIVTQCDFELLIAGGPVLETWLKFLINNIFENRVIPDGLNVSEIVTPFKKGDHLDCRNHILDQ